MVRFADNQPWNFGLKPSNYFEFQLKKLRCSGDIKRIKRNIALRDFSVNFRNGDDLFLLALDILGGIQTLDKLYDLTLNTLPLDLVQGRKNAGLQELVEVRDKEALVLVIRNAKPSGMIGFKTEPPQSANLFIHPFDIYSDLAPNIFYYVSSREEIIQALGEYQQKFKALSRDELGVRTAIDLVHGILFGYPVGDVLETNNFFGGKELTFETEGNKNNPNKNFPLLQHKPHPLLWASEWQEQIGIRGEEHLQRVYKRVLDCEYY